MQPHVLVTGSCGLIGSEVSVFFATQGFQVSGIDSNHRAVFFGPEGDTSWVLERLRREIPGYRHEALDIRDREGVLALMKDLRPDLIIHTAAQPSHDRAAAIPFLDFEVNAVGTLNLLEAARQFCAESPFIHMSTNKVYGDRPNTIALQELETRWDYADPAYSHGIGEDFSIDQSKHSVFGASKVAGDVMVQEYGRYHGTPSCCLRGGCLTGPNHSGVELHGFLSYLIKCNVEAREYKVFGYKGKQVRDNIHSEDVARFMFEFWKAPRCGEVYNLGGGKQNACSIIEAFRMSEAVTGQPMKWQYVDQNRIGDHICYYSDLRKMRAHYPAWDITKSLPRIFEEIAGSWMDRLTGEAPPGMKLLITGICGFAGSTLAKTLLEIQPGISIVGIDNLMRPGSEGNRLPLRKLGMEIVHGDIRAASDFENLPSADWVIDAAANPSVLAGVQGGFSSRQLMEHNLCALVNVLEYCKSRKAGFLLLSSSRVYSIPELASLPLKVSGSAFALDDSATLPAGITADGIGADFSTRPPISLYGSTKLASEAIAIEYGEAFGFPVWITRCGVLAGAGQFGTPDQGIFAYWLNAHLRRRGMRYIGFGGTGRQVRDAFHPRDLAALLTAQMDTNRKGGQRVYTAGGGRANSMSLAELTAWCDRRFRPFAPAPDPRERLYDIPWVVMDNADVERDFGWRIATPLPKILEEIALHAEANPNWLERSGP